MPRKAIFVLFPLLAAIAIWSVQAVPGVGNSPVATAADQVQEKVSSDQHGLDEQERDSGEPLERRIGAHQWRAGVARINITPDRPMWMAGYAARNRPAEGKLSELWAKALALEDRSGNTAVLITLDLIGLDRELCQSICNSLKQAHSLNREQIAICASHTHTGPVVGRNLAPLHYLQLDSEQQELVDQYEHTLKHKIVDLVGQALARRRPGRLSWGSGNATFAANRRANAEAEVPQLRAAGQLRGPCDHDVPVLSVNSDDGKLVAVVFGYACHATVLDFYHWSGDYPGFAQAAVEEALPGCVAMFWAGCGADQNPLPRRKVELAREYGEQLAEAVQRVLGAKMSPLTAMLLTSHEEIDLPLDALPSREEIVRDIASTNEYISARAKMLLAEIDAGRPLKPSYPYPVAVWRLGEEVQFVTLGGEVVVDFALRLKEELSGKATWVAGFSNDVMAYIPSRRVLSEGGYEGGGAMVYYGLPATWAPEVEQLIVRAVHKQLQTASEPK